jgi:hypothetical protein
MINTRIVIIEEIVTSKINNEEIQCDRKIKGV